MECRGQQGPHQYLGAEAANNKRERKPHTLGSLDIQQGLTVRQRLNKNFRITLPAVPRCCPPHERLPLLKHNSDRQQNRIKPKKTEDEEKDKRYIKLAAKSRGASAHPSKSFEPKSYADRASGKLEVQSILSQ